MTESGRYELIDRQASFLFMKRGFPFGEIRFFSTCESDSMINWEAVYKDEGPAILGFLRKRTDLESANDILQETFMKVMEISRVNREPDNVRAYLFQTARNLLYNHYKSNAQIERHDSVMMENLSAGISAESSYLQNEMIDLLRKSEMTLKGIEQEVFDYRFNFGLKSSEIAIITGKSDRHIRRILETISRQVRSVFSEAGWETDYDK